MAFNFIETSIPWLIIIEPRVFEDERGFFMETYHRDDFARWWINTIFIQDNHSKSNKWVLRGLHFQTINTQAKLVRVAAGSVYDVAVDLRKYSSTYGKYFWCFLSAQNKKQLYIPKGFWHGFLTLEDNTEFLYKCDDIYNPVWDGGISYDDLTININWGTIFKQYSINSIILSEKDKKHPTFEVFNVTNPF